MAGRALSSILARSDRSARSEFEATAVRSVEAVTATTALVEWCERGVCYYAERGWVRSAAKRDGICALSGAPIRRGDPVFRPRAGTSPPDNVRAMIIADLIVVTS
ncbi:DUF3331 domain-containing protein [Paraburkholderia strydomiana]|uniref:DUF3331 domain-containing protein n=1 Tax=Paraburkholderia strydomiana TaxID=1245417 RepID=UPI003335AAB1